MFDGVKSMGKSIRHKQSIQPNGAKPDGIEIELPAVLNDETKTEPRCDGPPGNVSPLRLSPSIDTTVIPDLSVLESKVTPPSSPENETEALIQPRVTSSPKKTPPPPPIITNSDYLNGSVFVTDVGAPSSDVIEAKDPKAEPGYSDSPRIRNGHEALTAQDKLNFFGRWIEISRFLGMWPQAVVAEEVTIEGADFDNQMGSMVDKISGVVIAAVMHLTFRDRYKKVKSLNPLYRNFKTLATAGTELGLMISDLWLLPQLLATAVFALGIGLLAIPYWLYREYILESPPKLRNADYKTGPEGWSKYGKTFLVFGMYLGETIGSIFAFALQGNFLRNIAIFGAVGSVVSFLAGLVIVPLVNKKFKHALITDKNRFRNNYIRSGITLGIAVGSVIGFILGTFLFPGLGSLIGMAIGTAFGSVVGGIVLGIYGYKITEYVREKWNGGDDPDNSWDYASRNTSYLFGFAGAAIGFFIPVPGGALIGAAIGSAIASTVGWLAGLVLIKWARITAPIEPKALTLPWTQRIANGSMIGSMIGAALGFGLGFITGPGGAIMGATLGFSAGAIAGGLAYGLYDKMARKLITAFFLGKTVQVLPASPSQQKIIGPEPESGNDIDEPENENDLADTDQLAEQRASAPAPAVAASTHAQIVQLLDAQTQTVGEIPSSPTSSTSGSNSTTPSPLPSPSPTPSASPSPPAVQPLRPRSKSQPTTPLFPMEDKRNTSYFPFHQSNEVDGTTTSLLDFNAADEIPRMVAV